MPLTLQRVWYEELNARQKENYNFLKLSSVLADYGFMTIRLTDDWEGADFIAQHIGGEFRRVQLKSRLTFARKYEGKNLDIAFPHDGVWYLYPHDELLQRILVETKIAESESWRQEEAYSYPHPSPKMLEILETYRLVACTERAQGQSAR